MGYGNRELDFIIQIKKKNWLSIQTFEYQKKIVLSFGSIAYERKERNATGERNFDIKSNKLTDQNKGRNKLLGK